MKCRHCNKPLEKVFCNLISCPPANSLLNQEELAQPESCLPLRIYVCTNCFLVQTDEIMSAREIFDQDYAYFSSFSASWLTHAQEYVEMMIQRFRFTRESQVIEIASNDGYLLQYFKPYNIPVLGVDPTANTAAAAKAKGIETIVDFFGAEFALEKLVKRGIRADLIIGNNVLGHVPDINDFVEGLKIALGHKGIITMEFPHLVRLIEGKQFDTIYHEHFSYLSCTTVGRILKSRGLELFDVEELTTHGGSLRIFVKHQDDKSKSISTRVQNLLEKEADAGISHLSFYAGFQNEVDKIRADFLKFLIEAKAQSQKVIGYGAAAKGTTLINYAGLKGNDLIQFVVDASPHKQGKYLPGSHIPVYGIEKINEYRPNYIIILPWNIKKEISAQLHYCRSWGAKFVTFIPDLLIS